MIYTTAGLSFKQLDAISWNIPYQWWFLKEGSFVISCGGVSPVAVVDVSRDIRTICNWAMTKTQM